MKSYNNRSKISPNYATNSLNKDSIIVKKGIWLYFWLLLFEGALRKWVFPGLATPLLVIRDPIAIYIIFKALKSNLLPSNGYLVTLWTVSIICIPFAVFLGHGNVFVAIYGARIFLFHFPLIFIIGNVFQIEDVILFGKRILALIIPTTILIAAQFYSPQSAFVNRGVGGDEKGAGFGGALGFSRPPGFFSFTSGNVLYYCIAICFILYFWLSEQVKINRILLICYTIAFVIAFPMCISRSLFFQTILSSLFGLIAISRNSKIFVRLLLTFIIVAILILILQNTTFFQTSFGAFSSRFESANQTEGGVKGVLLDRFLGGLISALFFSDHPIPYFGYGIGLGTNVGAMLTTGAAGFIIAEEEWGRLVGEMGFVLGIVIILIRVILGAEMMIASYKAIGKKNLLPWLLMSWTFLAILQNQLGQPTALGFTVIAGGLVMASLNNRDVSRI